MVSRRKLRLPGARHSQSTGWRAPFKTRAVSLLLWGMLLFTVILFQGQNVGATEVEKKEQPPRGAPAARLLPEEFSSEHWEFTARFDSGHLLFVHFLITNIGWGDRTAVVVGHVVTPDGQTRQFGNARRKNNWRLSRDRLRFEIGSHILDLHDPQYHLQVNKKNTRLDLRFQADTSAVWSQALTQSGYALDLLAVAAPVDGTLWIKGMEKPLAVHGVLAATHSWMRETGPSVMARRVEFFTLQKEFPLYGIDLTTPTGGHSRWLIIKQPGKNPIEADMFELVFEQERNPKEDSGYGVPDGIRFHSGQLNGQFNLERIILRHDPFANLPQPLRFLASSVLNLHPLQVWAFSSFTFDTPLTQTSVSLSSELTTGLTAPHNTGVTAITFLTPFPKAR